MFVTGISNDGDGVSALTLSPRPNRANHASPVSQERRLLLPSVVSLRPDDRVEWAPYRPASQTSGRGWELALSQRRPTASNPFGAWTIPANSLLTSLNAG